MVLPIYQGIHFDGYDRGSISFPATNLTGDFTIELKLKSVNKSTMGTVLYNTGALSNHMIIRNDFIQFLIAGGVPTTYSPSFDLYNEMLQVKIDRIAGKIYIKVNDNPTFEGNNQFNAGIFNTIGLNNTFTNKLQGSIHYLSIKDNGLKVLEYKFDEGQGNTILDYSGNGQNGTLERANWIIKRPFR